MPIVEFEYDFGGTTIEAMAIINDLEDGPPFVSELACEINGSGFDPATLFMRVSDRYICLSDDLRTKALTIFKSRGKRANSN